jgi:hypothetical protein
MLALLGDHPILHISRIRVNLTFMGPCIANVFQYISKRMQLYTVYLYFETALYVSGGTSTHHQERIQLYIQHLVFVRPLLLPAAIVDELCWDVTIRPYRINRIIIYIRRLTTGIRSEKCVVRRFRRCANVVECTYTNLDSIGYHTPTLYGIAYCS